MISVRPGESSVLEFSIVLLGKVVGDSGCMLVSVCMLQALNTNSAMRRNVFFIDIYLGIYCSVLFFDGIDNLESWLKKC